MVANVFTRLDRDAVFGVILCSQLNFLQNSRGEKKEISVILLIFQEERMYFFGDLKAALRSRKGNTGALDGCPS